MACLDDELNLNVFDVATSARIFQKKSFYTPSFSQIFMLSLRALMDEVDKRTPLLKKWREDSQAPKEEGKGRP